MAEPFIGEIRAFGFNFAPVNWAFCNGQLLPISQNTALFSIIGTVYGGDGKVTFALPNLQGRSAVGQGQGPGLSAYVLGEVTGTPEVTLLTTEMPGHRHSLQGRVTMQSSMLTAGPAANSKLSRAVTLEGSNPPATMIYSNVDSVNALMAPQTIGVTGGMQPHANQQPYLVLNYCICLQGVYPPKS